MYRKLVVIFVLAAGLATLLILRPWKKEVIPPPRFFDRLPDADIIGKTNVLDLSRSLSSSMYYFKIPIREFLSHDFILSQGKTFGIDLQKPMFFFANQEEWEISDFGVMSIVTDSSKVLLGLDKLKQALELKDTIVSGKKVVKSVNDNFYLTYGKNWIFAYYGNKFEKKLNGILTAKRNEIPPKWREFLNSTEYNNTNAVAYFDFKELKDYGVNSSSVSLFNDSSSLYLQTTVNQMDSLKFSLRDKGPSYPSQEFTKYQVNLHCNSEKLTYEPEDPLYKLTSKHVNRVNFPMHDLLKAWTGDVSYRQGGIQEIEERYIESVLDDNFNVTEVTRVRKVKVPSFSLYMSVNDYCDTFINQLYSKGILTDDGEKHRLLLSPPMNMNRTDSTLIFHTGKYIPATEKDSVNQIVWTYKHTPYKFVIDSTNTSSIYTTIQIPLKKILEDNLPNYGDK